MHPFSTPAVASLRQELSIIDLNAVGSADLHLEPFPYTIIFNFLNPQSMSDLLQDFPRIESSGSFSLSDLQYGPSFQNLVQELESAALRDAIAQKFSIDLEGRPTLITIRGRTRSKDGQIHTDTKSKLITVLLYLNPEWETTEGRLRLLTNARRLDDYVEEVTPLFGTCLIFRVTENCWHGHKPFVGVRRTIQMNYLADDAALRHHVSRHRFSAKWKALRLRLRGTSGYQD